MKSIALIFAVLFMGSAGAETCPLLQGDYIAPDGTPVRYEQKNCQRLTRYSAPQIVGGKWVFAVSREFEVNGAPFCIDTRCEYLTLDDDVYKFTFDFDGRRSVFEHGLCTNRETLVSKKANGHLLYQLSLKACEDGFSGRYEYEIVPAPDKKP